jgi:hypothetical protein
MSKTSAIVGYKQQTPNLLKSFSGKTIRQHPFWFSWSSLLISGLFLALPLVIFSDFSSRILFLASIIAGWWLLHRLVKEMAPQRWVPRLLIFIIFFLFLFQFSGILQPISDFLESIAFNPANLNFSLLFLVKAIVWLIVALGITSLCMEIIERRLRSAHAISPSAQVLLVKSLRVVFYAVALLIVMGGLGINLTALTVFFRGDRGGNRFWVATGFRQFDQRVDFIDGQIYKTRRCH